MPKTLILTQVDVERLMKIKTAIRVIERAFKAQALGRVVMPPKVYLSLPDGDFRAMLAAISQPACCGIKWVNVHPRNPGKGLPTVMGTIILNDPRTGFPLTVMDGLSVTRLRTAAASGAAARALANPDARVLGLVGCGAQALHQALALREVCRLRTVNVWGYRAGEARRFVAQARRRLDLPLRPARTVRKCVEDADIIVTVTSSRRPLVMRNWLKPGTHLNAIGADAPGKQELDPHILQDATVVVDDLHQAIYAGEVNVPIAKGVFKPTAIHGTLGDVLLGKIPGRTTADELTVFDSTGIAVHDVALGFDIFQRALRRRVGRPIQFFSP